MGLTLQEVIDNELLSDEVINCIPESCECGSAIEFTETLRQVYCSNSKCFYKIAARLEKMAKAMKVDGWGEATCITVCKTYGLQSPYQAFLLPQAIKQGRLADVAAFEKKVNDLINSPSRRARLWEVVKYGGVPNIEQTAYKIFDGYDNIEAAYKDIEEGGLTFIAGKLGIKNIETGVLALNTLNTLMEYKDELLFGEKQFEVYKPKGETLQIAITGGVYGFRNKGEYVNHLNSRYAGKVNAVLMGGVTNAVDVLVSESESSSNKYKKAVKINEKYVMDGVKNGDFTLEEVGTYRNESDFKKIGEKIVLTDSIDLIKRLDKVYK